MAFFSESFQSRLFSNEMAFLCPFSVVNYIKFPSVVTADEFKEIFLKNTGL